MQPYTPLATRPDALLARRNAMARIGAAAVVMLALFAATDLVTAGLLLAAVLVAVPLAGIPPGGLVRRSWPLLAAALAVGLVNVLFGEARGPVAVAIGPVSLHRDSLLTGLALGLRLLGIALVGLSAFASIDPTELADGLVQQLHVGPRFAIGALAAVRLMPVLAEEWQLLALARRARGVTAGSPAGWIRLQGSRLLSLLVGAIRRATRLALAMEARGLGEDRRRSAARPRRMEAADWWLLVGAAAVGAGVTGISLALGSYRFIFG